MSKSPRNFTSRDEKTVSSQSQSFQSSSKMAQESGRKGGTTSQTKAAVARHTAKLAKSAE